MLPIEYVIFFIIHSLLLGITVEKYILSTQKYGAHLGQEPACKVVEAKTVVSTICDQHVPHAAKEN